MLWAAGECGIGLRIVIVPSFSRFRKNPAGMRVCPSFRMAWGNAGLRNFNVYVIEKQENINVWKLSP